MVERRRIAVEGVVQGVGFRPFVHGLATALNLRGFVCNDRGGVLIDVEGDRAPLDAFLRSLTTDPPPLAVIDRVRVEPAPPGAPRNFPGGFSIAPTPAATSSDQSGDTEAALVSPDVATCAACAAELFDPADRRYRYPFVSCTHCGPRLTIVHALPYDRARTTMAAFDMCAACRREYDNPRDRRFHAQANACADCGPSVALRTRDDAAFGMAATAASPVAGAVAALLDGRIVALKGLGGYHLACDATNGDAVRRLRARKRRDAKPFAVMVPDLATARALCRVGAREAALLDSPERPIVLLAKRLSCAVAADVAPEGRDLGVMLPYTPLHHLLLADAGRPLVMTSGNGSDEPIAFTDGDALERLAGIADVFLTHDRPIATRCDDSVVRVFTGSSEARAPNFIRRSRGFAPRPVRVAVPFPAPVLAVGGHLKNTFCLGRGRDAILSPHVGDLGSADTYRALEAGIAHYQRLFDLRPELVAHDLHPDYPSTRLAERLTAVERVGVQHHHAHVASCVAEHGVTGPVIGVAFDGTGLGTDAAIWGGEFLLVDGATCQRSAHLAYVPLPGGDAAVRRPWRLAASHLWAAYGGETEGLPIPFLERADPGEWPLLRQMLEGGARCTPTSSVGRLFDAVAGLLGLADRSQFEAQAAMRLEAAADPSVGRSYAAELRDVGDVCIVEPAPLVRGIVADIAAGRPRGEIAGAFHNALRDVIVSVTDRIRERTGVRRVALTGGVFQNALLTERTAQALTRRGYDVLLHQRVPCNDGGLALGQAYVAGLTAGRGSPARAARRPEPNEVQRCV